MKNFLMNDDHTEKLSPQKLLTVYSILPSSYIKPYIVTTDLNISSLDIQHIIIMYSMWENFGVGKNMVNLANCEFLHKIISVTEKFK